MRMNISDCAVVIKNRKLENWAIADLDALSSHPERFKVNAAARRAVEPNKADVIDAEELLKRLCQKVEYSKVKDSERIFSIADPTRIALHSRSFRKFLSVTGHPDYLEQSRRPKTLRSQAVQSRVSRSSVRRPRA